MCLAIPSKIVDIQGVVGTIDLEGVTRTINMALLENARVGDYVLVHAGFAISVIDEAEAAQSLDLIRELAEASLAEG
ncbi:MULTISPECIES: HypC/HybG/HupF family hydrogenase formation chaperone [Desulfatibacillum]|jgi:hydrogenase expression/formation protein HypC|uniref:Hydrogenase expression/formation protein HypC n=2 Tax=Desulfatibacillum TaxID=218207 RepID=B8FG29_DESAL|nr:MULTISPECIES: HypC/HybG/HupF family hydrogenase formation chaperone [Desulfatibacillum]ACL03709.1 Hydrogenase expression/formation protein HypC [Desulfatibacillum aliphaticivorans]SHJ32290.1 hydrogenase expression/formation protein HypC [Desulfatibacillum alkenivorans DSM 16219]